MADQTLARYVNELNVLTLLRIKGATSRASLSRQLALTPATMSRLVGEMARRGLLRETLDAAPGANSRSPGRPGVEIGIDPGGAYFLGVEIGVGIVRFCLLDLAAAPIDTAEANVATDIAPTAVVRLIARHFAKLRRLPRFTGKIRAVGVTVPGLVTLDGDVVHLPILGWRDINLRARLSEAVGLPCFVENNATAAAFGAVYTQPALQSDCAIFLKLGAGCGGAAIVNGRLLRGAAGTAGEFGHMRIAGGGRLCHCGQRGCLETMVNLDAMARLYKRDAGGDPAHIQLPQAIARAARLGDPSARAAIASLARHLGLGLVTLANVFNPSVIVLGGIMRPVIELCLDKLRTNVAERIVPGALVPDIRMSALGIFECAVGAAAVAHHHSFDIANFDFSQRELAFSPPVAQ